MTERYMSVELPNTRAIVDFLGDYEATVEITRDGDKLRIQAIACDDRCTIMLDEELEIPETDNRR